MRLDRKDTRILLTVFMIIGLVWRLYLAFNYAPLSGDSKNYKQIAENLLSGNGYSLRAAPPYKPTNYRTPGYPFFIATLYLFNKSDLLIRIAQAIVDTMTCLLVYLMALSITSSRSISVTALFLASFCPYTAIYVTYILSETLATFFVALSTYLYILSTKHKRYFLYLLCGVTTGLAAMTRQNFLLLFILFLGSSWIFSIRGRRTSFVFKASLILFIGFLSIISPWIFRNYILDREFTPLLAHSQVKETGYDKWLSTWLDGEYLYQRYLWRHTKSADEYPDRAFDSKEEKRKVEKLLRHFFEDIVPPRDFGLAISSYSAVATPEFKDYLNNEEVRRVFDGFDRLANEKIENHPFRYYLYLRMRRVFIMWSSTVFHLYPFKDRIFEPFLKDDYGIFLKNLILFSVNLFYLFSAFIGFYFGIKHYKLSPILALPISAVGLLGLMTYPSLYEARFVLEAYPPISALASIALGRLFEE